MVKGKIYLIPATLGDSDPNDVLPDKVFEITGKIQYFLVENERTARRFLIKLGLKHKLDSIRFFVLDKDTPEAEFSRFLSLTNEHDIGVLSEAGMPCIADPGSGLVKMAHKNHIQVVPLTGPSSVLLALIASGLNGQNFAFNGYLPITKTERIKRIRYLETLSIKEKQAQIFMETPYRNHRLIHDIMNTCHPDTLLCIASNISLPDEFIKTNTIKAWKNKIPDLDRKPAIFILQRS